VERCAVRALHRSPFISSCSHRQAASLYRDSTSGFTVDCPQLILVDEAMGHNGDGGKSLGKKMNELFFDLSKRGRAVVIIVVTLGPSASGRGRRPRCRGAKAL